MTNGTCWVLLRRVIFGTVLMTYSCELKCRGDEVGMDEDEEMKEEVRQGKVDLRYKI